MDMDARITKLRQQRETIHSALGELLEKASAYTKSAPPELMAALDRVLEQADALLDQIAHERSEIDRVEKAGR